MSNPKKRVRIVLANLEQKDSLELLKKIQQLTNSVKAGKIHDVQIDASFATAREQLSMNSEPVRLDNVLSREAENAGQALLNHLQSLREQNNLKDELSVKDRAEKLVSQEMAFERYLESLCACGIFVKAFFKPAMDLILGK